MAEIATIFLSPFLEAFFSRMASGEFVDFFQQRKLSDKLLMKLKTTFLTLNAVLEDAEELQVTKPAVKEWLDKLKDAIYDAEQVLDEISTEALRSELDAQFQTTASKVRKSMFAFRNSFVQEIEPKIKEVLGRLEYLADQKNLIGLKEGIGGKSSERLPTTSLVEESDICGRGDDKEAIIKMLLSNDVCGNEMSVIAIVGMGGIGKTSLAQLVYNDNKVKDSFDHLAWVCVSEDFNVFKITKTILERVSSSTYDSKDLDLLQSELKEKLKGKKFLLVLDDVWNENYVQWEALCKPFKSGLQESKVIVTTRNDSVALVMRASALYQLKELAEEDCWSLFAKYAFHDGKSNAHGELEVIGRKIMEKCRGLPLAIKTIGALLRSKSDVEEWDKILKSELWDLPIDEMGILPALRLSYKYLSSNLKRCFAYCSIFPKDYDFKKDQLILLWMAEGFLHQPENKTMEEVGNEYFLTLESRSLFQKSSYKKSCFVMHNLVSDLAKSISGQFILRLEGDCPPKVVSNTRHLSYFSKQMFHSSKKFDTLHEAKRLRTFLHLSMFHLYWPCYCLTKKVVHDILPTLRCLRVLSLSNYGNITELLDSIGKFKYLRYLDLSCTNVERLPDSICQLYNLQTLILSYCRDLVGLPRDMWKLVNLRHLDIIGTSIKEMPIQLGRLKCLQTLTKFIIDEGSVLCIGELGKLTNLQGSLSISGLQNVESPTNAINARLGDKKYLEELELEWEYNNNFPESQKTVLDSLRPHRNLKSLIIRHYSGKLFSDWVGHSSFSNVASLRLQNCQYCNSLPPLGQLHSLQNLSIAGFDKVVTVGREFCGSGSSFVKPFAALKILRFERMAKWKEWISFGDENGSVAFPQLEKLYIDRCPNLTGGLPSYLPYLAKLEISVCPQLVAPLPRSPAIRELELRFCNEKLLNELPTGIQNLKIEGCHPLESFPKDGLPSTLKTLRIIWCRNLRSLPEGMIDSNSGLQKLVIDDCFLLMSLPKDGLPSTLKTLWISGCDSLVTLPEGMIDSNNNIQELVIRKCHSLVSFPKDGLPSTLKTLTIESCMKLDLPMHVDYTSVKELNLYKSKTLKSFPLDLFPKLYHVQFWECSNLISLTIPDNYEHDLVTLNIKISICPKFVSFPKGGLRASRLTSLLVLECESLRSLPENMHILLPSLEELEVSNCAKVESLPEGGLPSNLKSIKIISCGKLVASRMGWGLQYLPFLRDLSISGEFEDVESFPEAQLLPTSLTSLSIYSFLNLKSLDKKGLQHLYALENLYIYNCPNLKYMPEQGLPPSLLFLWIDYCPLLKIEWQSKKGKEWHKIAHVERKRMDREWIE
ncbi:putative disease resistance RPP13-like protein 1 [Corylus avellana]|uniref:putative disease resistance RPP13-like protein 1 n=1 Tax=Corylus avellana TaxID=13451 RepID=UPI001E1EC4FD|nr:putative disease resistance RPP13-like protein 1 [Corylus avellana]XP_059432766.1 putative disease resistance RPP13-like protein 1 [Corylus avellana]XP_059432767.1 putative disease resistance RPP13-like protein 1 [Corylus avellana]XP_059432768.1 putative disease resistance RPP13-like protein 1 [Corylus avellana]XP_059432769.1 putative disease resistance RPP13-like protein 1 [Corylus avellana]XP_059432771.1 putative disease resistance RPP13-like protein 1 [Corylus avellana]XP_059432772.1 pu